MYDANSSQTEKAHQIRHLVFALQEERSAVWSMYCEMAEMKAVFTETETIRPLLSRFSQLLIDYVSLGHFGICEQLLAEERQQKALFYAKRIYPAFSSTTVSAISFNDTYDDGKRNFKTDNLEADLSVLGENLAKRMELEDRLCSMLLH